MKNYFILFSTVLFLASCSSDSSGDSVMQEAEMMEKPPMEEEMMEEESIEVDDLTLTNLPTEPMIGDPGIGFDGTKFDDVNYPQMREWANAGVDGGIPLLADAEVKFAISETNSAGLIEYISRTSNAGGGTLKLTNGTYTIDSKVNMKSNVRIVGESRDGVILNITMKTTPGEQALDAIFFENVNNAGIDRVTIRGGFGQPSDFSMADNKQDFFVNSVGSVFSNNCWLSDVKILNSGNHAVSIWRGGNFTIRNCDIEGSWNKGAGGHGYVEIQTSYLLMYNTSIKKMRHIAIQSQHAEYNVFYKNTVEQDFNFHNGDSGNNLVEQNVNTLPAGLGSEWNAMMGPWSTIHTISTADNFLYKNMCVENNNGGAVTFSDDTKVYLGARAFQQDGDVFVTTDVVPSGGTLYPINL